MDAISIALMLFGVLELSNVLVLYLAPGSKRGNSVGFFDAYEKSKSDPEIHALVTYLVNWVAGTKLIAKRSEWKGTMEWSTLPSE